jgi:hypothetical protein
MINWLRSYSSARRSKEFRAFISAMKRPLNIIDLGGTVAFWARWGMTLHDECQITLINNHLLDPTNRNAENPFPFITNKVADAMAMTKEEFRQYDLIFSNSFFEHLEHRSAQARLATIIVESGVPYFIQVPNKRSPVDPHFPSPFVPFFALYPEWLRARLLTMGAFGSGGRAPSLTQARLRMRYYNPLGKFDTVMLFPNAKIRMERPLGIATSILATFIGVIS